MVICYDSSVLVEFLKHIPSLELGFSGFPSMMRQYANSEERLMSVADWLQGMGMSQYESHFMNTGLHYSPLFVLTFGKLLRFIHYWI